MQAFKSIFVLLLLTTFSCPPYWSQLEGNRSMSKVLIVDFANELVLTKKYNNSKYHLALKNGENIPYDFKCKCFLFTPHEVGEIEMDLVKNDNLIEQYHFNATEYPVPDVLLENNPFQNTLNFGDLANLEELNLEETFGIFQFEIVSFKMFFVTDDGVKLLHSDSNQLSAEMKTWINNLEAGSRVEFTNITLKRSDGKYFVVRDISLKVLD